MLYDARNLVRRFGSRTILDIAELSLEARKVYALIGPNGAGKTTLLNQLAFLDQPTEGTVFFKNQPVQYDRSSLTRLRRQVVLVDQTPILFSGTVWSNVAFGLKVRGVGGEERDSRIARALEQVGMQEFARSDVYGLSGGEVKRVAFARALALDPDVLLCDEPTANVDRQHQEAILKIIEHANSVRHTSVIFSTHYLSQSRRLAHQTILLQNGRLSPHLEENLFTGLLHRDKAGRALLRLADRFNLPCTAGKQGELPSSGPVRVHIIPESVGLQPCTGGKNRPVSSTTALRGMVTSIALQNGSVRVGVDIGVLLMAVMEAGLFQDNPVQVGQEVQLTIAPEAVVFLS